MKDFIVSPFYTITENKLLYLNQYEICKLPSEKTIKNLILRDEGVLLNKIDKDNKEKSILVLEPHPDDFSLSALGYTLYQHNAIVLNVFSKMMLESFTWKNNINISKEQYEKLRLEESKLAIEVMLKRSVYFLKGRINENYKEKF